MVFLSIVVIHIGDANPYLFVFNRVMDTMIDIIIGMLVNSVRLPRRKEKDILFISGMDDTLVIQYKDLKNEVEQDIYEKLHTSLYRDYTTRDLQQESGCVYFMVVRTLKKMYEPLYWTFR